MPSTTPEPAVALEDLAEILACPSCREALNIEPGRLLCSGCGTPYSIRDGVPLLARKGSADTWGAERPGETSEEYQENYEEVVRARQYNEKYRRQLFKRMSTRRELRVLERLLSTQPRCRFLLDIPSGGGRLSAPIAPAAEVIIEADIALGQILYGREASRVETPQFWMTASAFHIPLRDSSVDGAVCVRLSHHLPFPQERERLVHELLRVTRRFVIMTFFDENSPKNLLRRTRRALGLDRKPPKKTLTVRRVEELAREGGAELAACPHLAFLGSGHRYALMVKPEAGRRAEPRGDGAGTGST